MCNSFVIQKYMLSLNCWKDPTAAITHTSEAFSRMSSQVVLLNVNILVLCAIMTVTGILSFAYFIFRSASFGSRGMK